MAPNPCVSSTVVTETKGKQMIWDLQRNEDEKDKEGQLEVKVVDCL